VIHAVTSPIVQKSSSRSHPHSPTRPASGRRSRGTLFRASLMRANAAASESQAVTHIVSKPPPLHVCLCGTARHPIPPSELRRIVPRAAPSVGRRSCAQVLPWTNLKRSLTSSWHQSITLSHSVSYDGGGGAPDASAPRDMARVQRLVTSPRCSGCVHAHRQQPEFTPGRTRVARPTSTARCSHSPKSSGNGGSCSWRPPRRRVLPRGALRGRGNRCE